MGKKMNKQPIRKLKFIAIIEFLRILGADLIVALRISEVEFKVHDNLGTKPISKEPKFPTSLIEIEAISQTTFKGPVAACQSALS